jgi:hypothetical protein
MSNVGLLVPDILGEIMSRLPSGINQKFAFAQVSRYWRDVALNNHLFWSSFATVSEAELYRIPIVLERSGNVMLHASFYFAPCYPPDWHAKALAALVPHLARIETLDVSAGYSLPPSVVEVLLNSNLEFPALQTLRLAGPEFGRFPPVQLTAPQLRTLDIRHFDSENWAPLFSSSLENITLYNSRAMGLQPLLEIFDRCPRAWRVVYDSGYADVGSYKDEFFEAFTRRQPLAPALRELELRTDSTDLCRILKAGFPDIVLPTLTACVWDSTMSVITEALLPGVGPLVVFELDRRMYQVELRDDNGLTRRLQSWNDDAALEVDCTWEYLSVHYNLYKTVRELRIGHWDQYVEIFERYPPQLPDGITLVYISDGDEERESELTKKMHIPGLARLKFFGEPPMTLKSVLRILSLVEPPATRKVEVCIHNMKLRTTEKGVDAFDVFQSAFPEDCWAICNQCISHWDH